MWHFHSFHAKKEAMKKDYRRLIGNRLRDLRKQRRFTQEELADRANLNPSYYGRVERGEINLTIETLTSISEALQVELAEVFDFGAEVDQVRLKKEVQKLITKQKLPILLSVKTLLENLK